MATSRRLLWWVAAPLAALLVTVGMMLANAPRNAPPPLTEADLRNAMAMDFLGTVPAGLDIVRSVTEAPGSCVDLHRAETSLQDDSRAPGAGRKLLMRFGLSSGLTNWRLPGRLQSKPVAADLEHRLARASARAILDVARRPASTAAPRDWPERCTQRYWFDAPVYEGDFAFIDSGSSCGGLCGGGTLLALEYRDGHWRLVGSHPSWIA